MRGSKNKGERRQGLTLINAMVGLAISGLFLSFLTSQALFSFRNIRYSSSRSDVDSLLASVRLVTSRSETCQGAFQNNGGDLALYYSDTEENRDALQGSQVDNNFDGSLDSHDSGNVENVGIFVHDQTQSLVAHGTKLGQYTVDRIMMLPQYDSGVPSVIGQIGTGCTGPNDPSCLNRRLVELRMIFKKEEGALGSPSRSISQLAEVHTRPTSVPSVERIESCMVTGNVTSTGSFDEQGFCETTLGGTWNPSPDPGAPACELAAQSNTTDSYPSKCGFGPSGPALNHPSLILTQSCSPPSCVSGYNPSGSIECVATTAVRTATGWRGWGYCQIMCVKTGS